MKTIRQQAIEFVKKLDDEVLKNMLISSHTSTTHQWMQVYPDGSVSKTEEADNNTRHYVSYPDKEVANIYNISNANCGCNCDICTLYNHFESLTKEEFLDMHNEDDLEYCKDYTLDEAIYYYCTENGEYPEGIREQMLEAIDEIYYGYFDDEITTMEELADYINESDEWPLDVEEIIEANGWVSDTGEEFGICHNNEKRLVFGNDGNTATVEVL